MSLFNVVRAIVECQECGERAERTVEFRYGHVRQYEYVLGSELTWGPSAVGDPSIRRVLIDGWLSDCPGCGASGRCLAAVRNNRVFGIGSNELRSDIAEGDWAVDE